jgi:Bacteriophage replication protein O
MKKAAQQILRFKGFLSPRYTQVPDELFDKLMAHLSGAELKVLLYIIRRTFGFKKDSDNISLRQICHGIKTRGGGDLGQGNGVKSEHRPDCPKRAS